MQDINTIDNSLVNGFIKLWLYQFYLLAGTSWAFLIYDFERSFAVDIEKQINTKLKKWAGINLTVDNGLLFRSKENFGLGLTSITHNYEHMHLIKCELLQNSIDLTVQKVSYQSRQKCETLQSLESDKFIQSC